MNNLSSDNPDAEDIEWAVDVFNSRRWIAPDEYERALAIIAAATEASDG